MNPTNTLKITLSVLAIATLAACGGGGSSVADQAANLGNNNQVPVTPVTPVTPTPTPNTLSTTIVPATYATGSAEATLYDRINQVRLTGGFGTIAQDPAIDKAALAHAAYVETNFIGLNHQTAVGPFDIDPATGNMEVHVEHANWPGFTGVTSSDRIAAAGGVGYIGTGDVFADSMPWAKGADCASTFFNTVFHRSALLNTKTQFIGFGVKHFNRYDASGTYTNDGYICVFEYGQKTNANTVQSDWVGVYPALNQTNVPTTMGPEMPNPAPGLGFVGSPISIYFASAIGTINSFTMTTNGDSPVAVKLILQKDFPGYLSNSEAHILPTTPLASGTTYNVSFKGVLANGTVMNKDWSFTTAN